MRAIVNTMARCLEDDLGAEIVELTVVIVILAAVASVLFGPNGVLSNSITDVVNKISQIISNVPTSS